MQELKVEKERERRHSLDKLQKEEKEKIRLRKDREEEAGRVES